MKKKYQGKIQIPTKVRYAFIQIDVKGTAEEIAEDYFAISEAYSKERNRRYNKNHDEN